MSIPLLQVPRLHSMYNSRALGLCALHPILTGWNPAPLGNVTTCGSFPWQTTLRLISEVER